ncbi:MAG: helix-hairpin-helix domain-containing protein, partial [Candidatus Marinimicrobia bacterium]|nr:helix-hairpin-helix domain-containing protein [Candidatus Neomarinimicrobiota bacterium]
MSIFTQQEKLIIKFLLGVIMLGIVVTGYRHWFVESVPSAEKEILAFQAAAVRVAEEKEKIPNENRKNQLLKSVNINTSDKADIMTIPRIGPVTAERIILHREDHGLYNSVEELLNVKGIGPKTLEKIRT